MTDVEFWPEYGAGPLWDDGNPVDLSSLGLEPALVERLESWNARYSEDKVPVDGTGDEAWLAEGKQLLRDVRSALGRRHRVVATEPWWGEEPS